MAGQHGIGTVCAQPVSSSFVSLHRPRQPKVALSIFLIFYGGQHELFSDQ
jgi:hypothetical protein